MAQKQLSLVMRRIRGLIGLRPAAEVTDGDLLDRFTRHRDEEAFEELVERYGTLVMGLCRRLLRDAHDAEDAFQATFLILSRKAGSIRKQASVGSWLYGVAYRVAQEARTKSARRRVHERQAGEMDPQRFLFDESPGLTHLGLTSSSETETAWPDLRPVIDDELSRLPDKYRAPLILCYLQGKTNEEAARQLCWPTGTVKGRLSRARDLLRRRLSRRGVALSSGMLPLLLADHALAAVSPGLVASTVRAALQFASGSAATSATIYSLAEGVMKTMFVHKIKRALPIVLLCFAIVGVVTYGLFANESAKEPTLVRSARNGNWSSPLTWTGGKVPQAGNRVQIQEGHRVVYDVNSDKVIRSVHVNGTLTFAPDKDTRLDTGLIRIQPGNICSEEGFECDTRIEFDPKAKRPVLAVGTPDRPIDKDHKALIRLVYIEGMNKESSPAIVCCTGRMDFHGAPLSKTWVKLGDTANQGDTTVTLAEGVEGWRVGDRIILTATQKKYDQDGPYTEERIIKSIESTKVTLDKPLAHEHLGTGEYRGEVANLSRNVVVESANPDGVRGHTMYHKHSAGSLSYTEFRHLGKKDVLGRYTLHFHLCGDSMRGSYVIGNSIWGSHNRWLTIHGTNYLVVRDNVGYKSVGHGYFLEDGTEVYNVLDRNLAVGAREGKRLPKQVLPFDQNDGAGFWWANSLNTFTRNVAADNGEYGFRYEATPSSRLKLLFPVMQPDGKRKIVDIRTLPFVRFEDNEIHSSIGHYGLNLGQGVRRGGPDPRHPFIVRNIKIWNVHYAFRPQVPSLLVENMHIHDAAYGVYHPNYDNHVYRDMYISRVGAEPFNRGHDDGSIQYGKLAVDGLTFANHRSGGMPLIQISSDNPTGQGVSHFRKVKTVNWTGRKERALVNMGGGPRRDPKTEQGVPIYLHDWFGPGKHAMVVSTRSPEFKKEPGKYREEPLLTGNESRVAEVTDVGEFPKLLDPLDDLPPTTVITHIKNKGGQLIVRGTTSDNGKVTKVVVNGKTAKALRPNFAEWEITVPKSTGKVKLIAHAADAAGNVEQLPHVVEVGK